jgi:uncharacterized membrane protein YbhN (UPF0104 family)
MKKPLSNMHWTAQTTLIFLFKHLLAGVLGGCFFATLLLYYDVSKLWSMISSTSDGWLVVVMLYTGLCISMGWGIFSLAQERDDPPEDHMYY